MIYEVINPSDHVTLEAKSWGVASAAVLIVGNGKYGMEPVDPDNSELEQLESMPIFFLGGAGEWFEKTFSMSIDDFIQANAKEVADTLDSFVTGDRGTFTLAYEHAADKEAFRAAWEDKNRSSMSRIEQAARQYAIAVRGMYKVEP